MSANTAPALPPARPTAAFDALFQAAKAARVQAHAPYSGYGVGAAVLDADGRIHAGCNVENAAYPQGQCAEAGAIAALALAGGRRIREVVVLGAPLAGGDAGALCTPCGGCRQRLREFGGPDTLVHVCGPEGLRATFTLGQLLPFSFGPDNLGF